MYRNSQRKTDSSETDAVKQARYIFATGKLIHDQILKIQNRYLASCEDESLRDLSMSQLHAIRIVRKFEEVTMTQLAECLDVSPPSASAMVDRLVEKKVLCRKHSSTDRRKVVVRISPDAVKKADAIEADILHLFVDLVEKIGDHNAQKWCEVLNCVKIALDDFS